MILRLTDQIQAEGKCGGGQQNVMWTDDVKKITGIRSPQLAHGRINCRNLADVYVLQWAYRAPAAATDNDDGVSRLNAIAPIL